MLYLVNDASKVSQLRKYNSIATNNLPMLDTFINPHKEFHPRYCFCDAEGCNRFFDPLGDVYSCILALGHSRASVGRYYPTLQMKENNMLTRNIETIVQCRQCKYKFICGGGCANAVVDEEGNSLYPECDTILNEVHYDLPELFRSRLKLFDETSATD